MRRIWNHQFAMSADYIDPNGNEIAWVPYGTMTTNRVGYSHGGQITGKIGRGYNAMPKLGPFADLQGEIKFSFLSPVASNAILEYAVGHIEKPGYYVLSADVEFRVDAYGSWDYGQPWTFELKPNEYIKVLGNFFLRNFSVSSTVARMLVDVSVRTLQVVAPEFKIGFRCGVARVPSHGWVGVRFETFFVSLVPKGNVKPVRKKPRKRRPPKTTG